MIEDSYESRYTQKRARFCGPVSCVQCPKVPLPPIFSPAMLSRPVSCGGFLPSPGMPKHGGMTSGRATRTPFNEMWVKTGSWRTPQDHPCRVYYMRCGGGCQAIFSARPALRWPVPLFSVTWRTSAAAARRLQKEATRPALRWSVPLFYAAWRTSAAAARRLQKLTNHRTSCASLVRATVLCRLADFRRRTPAPEERSCAEAGHFCNNSYRLS